MTSSMTNPPRTSPPARLCDEQTQPLDHLSLYQRTKATLPKVSTDGEEGDGSKPAAIVKPPPPPPPLPPIC
ncbi:MAG: hypothetical protein R2857_00975 [Vampirovibrionales bacterium]